MNILITGAGLIGCHFAREMAGRGHKVVIYDVAPNASYVRSVAGDVPTVAGDIRDLPCPSPAQAEAPESAPTPLGSDRMTLCGILFC